MSVLVIAEKPSVANTVATVLGANKKGVNYLYNDRYIVSWCLGHLVKLDDPVAYGDRFAEKPWKFENLPIIPEKWKFSVGGSTKSQYYVLKSLIERDDVNEIVCATDAGREGECIFRYMYYKTGCTKPVKRLWVSSLEEKAIKKAFSELKDDSEYDNLYRAGLARAKADWLVGMNATRLFSVRYGLLLNIGRVQTPTLAMIVDRNNKVKNFVKEPFYKVDIDCGDFKATSVDDFKSEYEADKLAECVDKSDFTVVDLTEQQKSVAPPKLYDLTALQRDANSIYGYTAQQTLDYLQSLYEKKLATYPRTDSNYITDDMADTAKKLIESVYGVYEKIPHMPTDVTKCINNAKVSDHHAVLPTEQITSYDLSSLPTAEYNILFMIAVRLCVATGEDYIYCTFTCELKSNNSDKPFVSKATYPVNLGWKFIDISAKEKDKNEVDPRSASFENLPSDVQQALEEVWNELSTFRPLCAQREGPTGVNAVNDFCEDFVKSAFKVPSADDMYNGKVIIVRQNDSGLGVANGDVAIIFGLKTADSDKPTWYAFIGDLKKIVPAQLLPKYDTAFAITIHQSQGSGFRDVAIFLPTLSAGSDAASLCTRELLYTGITRSEKTCQIFGAKDVLGMSLKTVTQRTGGLPQRLKERFSEQG